MSEAEVRDFFQRTIVLGQAARDAYVRRARKEKQPLDFIELRTLDMNLERLGRMLKEFP